MSDAKFDKLRTLGEESNSKIPSEIYYNQNKNGSNDKEIIIVDKDFKWWLSIPLVVVDTGAGVVVLGSFGSKLTLQLSVSQ